MATSTTTAGRRRGPTAVAAAALQNATIATGRRRRKEAAAAPNCPPDKGTNEINIKCAHEAVKGPTCELETKGQAPACEVVEETIVTVACEHTEETIKAPAANAFGCTFVLAPSFCLKIGCEDGLLLAEFAKHEGLAILVSSELRPTDRVVELLRAELAEGPAETLLSADALLGADAVRLLSEPNAGGASRVSEALSVEVLARAFGASLSKTELEIVYWPKETSITDFSVLLDGTPLGVSVTRALGPPNAPFDAAAAQRLLLKKLGGVVRSTETCLGAWRKQILHVWAPTATASAAIEQAYATLPQALVSDTVVLVTTAPELPQLFTERASKLEKPTRIPKGRKDAEHLTALAESDPCRGNGGRGAPTRACRT